MFKATIISTLCALLLADASLAAVIKRECRALHQDSEYPEATAAVTCDWEPASTSTDPTSTESSTESTSTEPTSSSTWSSTEAPTSTSTWSSTEETTSSCTDSSSTEPTQTPPAQPQHTEPSEQPYQGKFYQISPAANSSMCLSALVTWEGTIGRSDLVNLRPCECDEPEVQNLWTFERNDDQTTIMIGKPKSAFDTTWCLDGRLNPSNTDNPHLWSCKLGYEPKTAEELQAAQNFYDVQHWQFDESSGQISFTYQGNTKFCLDVEFGKMDGSATQIYECDPNKGNPNQQWQVTEIEHGL